MSDQQVHIFGIRHHGPGSAKSLVRALEALQPDCVLIEGPPDAEDVLPLVVHEQMVPPVALLVYVPDEPARSAFYPFAEFSPEWQALRYALNNQCVLRFMDLPQWFQLAEQDAADNAPPADVSTEDHSAADAPADNETPGEIEVPADLPIRHDPLGQLAAAAGFSDGERWWDQVVEGRTDGSIDIFAAVNEAMATLREDLPAEEDLREQRREAYMRKTLREAMKEGHAKIAVVCGAWHAPALDPAKHPAAKHDNDLLKGLKKVKTQAAWSPWTYPRLASDSGYGAGVVSPAWYEMLWNNKPHLSTQWMTRVARLMREQDLDTSSAHVIEAVRLAETLASLRNRPLPGMDELDESALTVICGGQDGPMHLVRRKLVVGDRLGEVPDDAPMPPLQRDLAKLQKSLRLKASSEVITLDLDLRKPNDLARSHLLHRLALLGIRWGEVTEQGRRDQGTFHEYWEIQWTPEMSVQIIEASRWGNTVHAAATAKAADAARRAESLRELAKLLEHAMLADLHDAVGQLVDAIQRRSATGSDTSELMRALPPLAKVARYGNVRKTDASLVDGAITGIAARVCVGLHLACVSLADDAAQALFSQINETHAAIKLLDRPDLADPWFETLLRIANQSTTHPMLAGQAVRLLHDAARIDPDNTADRLGLALSHGVDRTPAAQWIEGFLAGSGLILIHDEKLWAVIDRWLVALTEDQFTENLPLLRRTFATFAAPERRQMGERVKRTAAGPAASSSPATAEGFNRDRADKVLPVLQLLFGNGVKP